MTMAERFSDDDFKEMVKSVLDEAREEAKDLVLREGPEPLEEYGDEFGDVDLGNFSDFKKIFIKPFTDVAKTALGHLSKISSSARTAVEKFLRGIPTLIVPFLSARYDDIFSREERRLQEIQRKYGDVFDKASEVFKGDAKLVAFMLNPGMMLAAAAATESSSAILEIAEAISGQSPEVTSRTTRIRQSLSVSSESTLARLVLEDEQEDKQMLSDLVNDRDFQRSINESPKAREIKRDTQDAINSTLNEFREDARKMSAANTFEQVSKLIDQKVVPPAVEGMKPEDLAKSTAVALTQFKHAYIDGITQGLKMAVKEFSTLDIPEGADLTKVYDKVINEIDGMKK